MEAQFTEETPGIFWLDGFNGSAQGGYFLRNKLKEFIDSINNTGKRVVGIKLDGSYNLEVIVETNDSELGQNELTGDSN